MALRMQTRASRWASLTDVDLRDIHAENFKLTVSYTAAARLTWSCRVAQHMHPIADGAFIIFWDDDAEDANGDPFSALNPIFIGYVETPTPGDFSRRVDYIAFDPTYRAAKEVTVFSEAWPQGTVPDTPPIPDDTAVPRLVWNVRITNDPDWAFQVGGDGTLGELIGGILDYTYHPLYWLDAAPGDGTSAGNGSAYEQSDLDALDHKPQEKLDFQSESVRSAIDRAQRYDPRFKLIFDAPTRKWRLRKLPSAPAVTLTLNDYTADHPVLSLKIMPSTEQCVTAISFYGPPAPYTVDLRWDDPIDPNVPSGEYPSPMAELIPLGDPKIYQIFFTAHGQFDARFWTRFIVADPELRRGARELPTPYQYQNTNLIIGSTEYPLVLLSYDYGASWIEWPAFFDHLHGVLTIARAPFYQRYAESGPLIPGSTQTFFCPTSLRLIWAPFGPPLKVRVPTSGFEGTAYTVAGRKVESFRYDEALMVGREFGTPVTTTARRAQFTKYGQTILDQSKNIVWTGGAELLYLDWRFLRLNRRVNFAAANGSGGTTTTGWEAIDAFVTDVEYDFAARRTRLTFSSDALSLFGVDPEELKAQLGIKALQQMEKYETTLQFRSYATWQGYRVNEVSGVMTTTSYEYIDPETGMPQ